MTEGKRKPRKTREEVAAELEAAPDGARLKRYRLICALSRPDLAARSGVDAVRLKELEQSQAEADEPERARLAAALNTPVATIWKA